MIDIKVITIKDLLPIYSLDNFSTITPRTLDIRGERFSEAQEVRVNGIEVSEFIIVSDTQILAQVPKGQEAAVINTISVLAESPSKDRNSILHFELGKSFRPLRGIEKTVQLFCKILIQTPGSDKFSPQLGGGLLAMIGANFSTIDNTLSANLVEAINRTQNQIMAMQRNNPRIPPDERLLSASIEAVGFNQQTTTLAARVFLSMVSGAEAVANLTF